MPKAVPAAEGAPQLTGAAELRERRKEARKAKKVRDERGLAFYNLKGQADTAALPAHGLQRTATQDEEGRVWEFKESLGIRTTSIRGAPTSSVPAAAEKLPPSLAAGLREALAEANMPAKYEAVSAWCSENGAGFLQEVLENISDVAEALELPPGEAAKLGAACAMVATRHKAAAEFDETSSQSSVGRFARQSSALLARQSSAILGTATSVVSGLARRMSSTLRFGTLSRTATTGPLGRAPSITVGQLEERAASQGLVHTTSITRTTSYVKGQVTCQEVTVGVIKPDGLDEEEEEDLEDEDSDDEVDEAEADTADTPTPPRKGLFVSAVNAVRFAIRANLLGKRKREELEAFQLSQVDVEPTPEENVSGKLALDRLSEFKAPVGCTCLTLVVPSGTVSIESLQKQSSGRRARKYLQLVAAAVGGEEPPKNGLAIFMKIYGKEDRENELIAIEPPAPLKAFAMSDGPTFATEVLAGLYVDTSSTACAFISGDEALLYRFFSDHGRVEAKIQPRLQKRQKKGGQSALRIARLAEEVRAAYVRIVAERVNTVFIGEDGMNVDMVAIGGSRELADNLHSSEHLDYRIKATMKRAPNIKDIDHEAEIQKKVLALRNEAAASSALAVLREFEEKAHTELAAYGLKEVVKRIEEYNISKLIYATGGILSSKLVAQAESIGGGTVVAVPDGSQAHAELTRKWGGAFALTQWKAVDYDD